MRLTISLAAALLLLAASSSAALASDNQHSKSETPEAVEGSTEVSAGELQTAMQLQQQQLEQLQQQVEELQLQVQAALPADNQENTSTTVASPAPERDSRNARCQQLRFGSNWQALALAARTCR